ncbi:MAG: PIN domain-containing protein [Blastocatellia bacterium]
MIVADTNILSTFARIQRLDLLFTVAETDELFLTPSVVSEIKVGLRKGLAFLQPIVDGLSGEAGFSVLDLTDDERNLAGTLPTSLNAGERECIAICAERSGGKLFTNDKRARNYCQANRIPCLDLKLILRRLWQAGHCTKDEVRSLIEEIERSEPEFIIKGKDEILR